VSNIDFGVTILESDYRNIFSRFDEFSLFHSGPAAIYHMLKHIDIKQEIVKNLKIFPTIKSTEKRKKIFILIKAIN
jgi:hypothetical protein